jgi:hypothetical protein
MFWNEMTWIVKQKLVIVLEPGQLLEESVGTSTVGLEVSMEPEQLLQSKGTMDSSNQSLQDQRNVFYD